MATLNSKWFDMVSVIQARSAGILQTERSHSAEAIITIGSLLLALPMVIYGVEHFIYAQFVATLVPGWIPWHMFWTYFVGVALIAAGFSMVLKKKGRLSATLLGAMIFAFVMLIHTVLLTHGADDVPTNSVFGDMAGRLNNCFKDLGLSGAAFIFAGMQSQSWKSFRKDNTLLLGRFIFGFSIIAFGVLHFVYPGYAPGIQPMFESISFPIPGHLLWVLFTAIVFLISGICIMIGEEIKPAATWLGITILVFDLLVWVPQFAARPADLTGNWLKDIGLAGGALILAGGFSKKRTTLTLDTKGEEIVAQVA